MSSLTLAEKLLSRAAGRTVRADEIAVVRPDLVLGNDVTLPTALAYLARLDGGTPRAPFDARRIAFALDHLEGSCDAAPPGSQRAVTDYARDHGVRLFAAEQGAGHQVVLETGLALPGHVAVGVDAQAVCYGALNAFATGVGPADLAGVLYCGQLWLRVPATIRIDLSGRLRPGVSARDLALALVGRIGADGAAHRALEFGGPGVARLDMDDRIVLANMAVETGAKAALFRCDIKTREYLAPRIGARAAAALVAELPDPGARYAGSIAVEMGEVEPMVALPDPSRRVLPLSVAPPTSIDTVHLGSRIGGRLKDYAQALDVLRKGGGPVPGVRLVVTPASARVRADMEALGMLDEFVRYGAQILSPGGGDCAPCGGEHSQGVRVASTAYRHFEGRWHDAATQVYLASPAECARAAVTGQLGGGERRAA
ncbi:MAG: aconitase family protein [Pseudomonadota bacterium]|nr:aconitase family protein [Pseudomonadota bacterium]